MVTIDCTFRENEKAMHKDMVATGKEMLEATGYKDIQVNAAISAPGNANHEMGTARMGHDAKTRYSMHLTRCMKYRMYLLQMAPAWRPVPALIPALLIWR